MKRAALIALLALAAIGGGAWYWQGRAPGETALVLSGNVDIREVTLAFRVAGRVAEVAVEEGDRVRAGDVVARLDPAPLAAEVAQAEAALAAAQAAEALAKAGPRAEEIARLRAQMEGAAAAVANARAVFDRQEALTTSSAASAQVLDNARAARAEAEALHEAARQAWLAARNGTRPEEIRQAEANRAAAEAQRDAAAIRLADAVLTAPAEATVLTRAVEPGAMVAAGTGVVSLSLDRPVRVRAYVREPDLGLVAPGTAVLVETDARPGRPYSGTVGFVSPRAEFTPKQVETQDLRTTLVYRIRITLDDADDLLRQGMPVTVRLAGGGG